MGLNSHLQSKGFWHRGATVLPVLALASLGISAPTPAEGNSPNHIARLRDRQEIEDLAYCYAAGTDAIGRGDEAEGRAIYHECFTDDALIEAWSQGSDPNNPPDNSAESPDEWADFAVNIFAAQGFIGTQHLIGNVRINLSGNTATMTSYLSATHVIDPSSTIYLATGTYKDFVVKTPQGWKIAHRRLYILTFQLVQSP